MVLYIDNDDVGAVDRGREECEELGSVYGEMFCGPGRSMAHFSVGLKMEPRLLCRRQEKTPSRMKASPATPPTTPPAMAPVLLEREDEVELAVDEEDMVDVVDVELGDAEEELVAFWLYGDKISLTEHSFDRRTGLTGRISLVSMPEYSQTGQSDCRRKRMENTHSGI